MAIYHLSTKPVSRSSGRTATASIAYRAGIAIKDERTGKEHDYTRRSGVVFTQLHTPNNLQIDRAELWNLAETTEKRSNSRTAREIVVSLPYEVTGQDRSELVNKFAKELADKYGVAVDVAIHTPDEEGDDRNHHAHIMLTTRKLERLESGKIALTSKSQLEMSGTQLFKHDLPSAKDELKAIRKQWADLTNDHMKELNIPITIDHRSHKDRGLDQLPTQKLGWEASAMERNDIATDKGDYNRMVKEYNQTLSKIAVIDKSLNDLTEQREQSNDRARDRIERTIKLTESAAYNTAWAAKRAGQVNERVNDSQQGIEGAERAIDASAGAINQANRRIAEHQRQLEAQAETEQAKPKTAKEFVERLSQEQRQKVKEISSKTISQYTADINSKAVELYEKATPPNRRAKPLFAHYAYSDMKEVQPYKSLAQREIHEKDPSRYKDYANAIEVTNAMQDMERREGYQRQAERIREPSQDKGRDR